MGKNGLVSKSVCVFLFAHAIAKGLPEEKPNAFTVPPLFLLRLECGAHRGSAPMCPLLLLVPGRAGRSIQARGTPSLDTHSHSHTTVLRSQIVSLP